MTTSFAHFVRGNFAMSVRANVGGALLALCCAAQIPWCWWSAWRGRLWYVTDPARSLLIMVSSVAAVAILNWILRLIAD